MMGPHMSPDEQRMLWEDVQNANNAADRTWVGGGGQVGFAEGNANAEPVAMEDEDFTTNGFSSNDTSSSSSSSSSDSEIEGDEGDAEMKEAKGASGKKKDKKKKRSKKAKMSNKRRKKLTKKVKKQMKRVNKLKSKRHKVEKQYNKALRNLERSKRNLVSLKERIRTQDAKTKCGRGNRKNPYSVYQKSKAEKEQTRKEGKVQMRRAKSESLAEQLERAKSESLAASTANARRTDAQRGSSEPRPAAPIACQPSAPARPAPTVPVVLPPVAPPQPQDKYFKQLSWLKEAGFTDMEMNRRLLDENNGDLKATIWLITMANKKE